MCPYFSTGQNLLKETLIEDKYCHNQLRKAFWYIRWPQIMQYTITAWKVPKQGVISGPYFPAFRLNTEKYEVSLRIQSEYGKIRTRNHSVFGHFPRSARLVNFNLKIHFLLKKIFANFELVFGSRLKDFLYQC